MLLRRHKMAVLAGQPRLLCPKRSTVGAFRSSLKLSFIPLIIASIRLHLRKFAISPRILRHLTGGTISETVKISPKDHS